MNIGGRSGMDARPVERGMLRLKWIWGGDYGRVRKARVEKALDILELEPDAVVDVSFQIRTYGHNYHTARLVFTTEDDKIAVTPPCGDTKYLNPRTLDRILARA